MAFTESKTNSLSEVVFDSASHLLIAAGGADVSENHRSYTHRELIAWSLPDGDVRWHVVERAKERISDLAIRPITNELATKCTGAITIWSSDGKPLRNVESDFLAGPIVFSPHGELLVSPHGNNIKVRSSDTGQIVATLPISKSTYTSAKATAFVPGTSCLLAAAQVIGARGQTSGQLLLLDIDRQEVLKTSAIEIWPTHVVIDPRGGWAGVSGQRRNRGYLMFWDLKTWKCVAEQGAHGSSLDSIVVSPNGEQLATTGTDHVIRIWDTTTWKTVAKLDKHMAEDNSSPCIAWSPNGEYLAFASSGFASTGAPPRGCVAVYVRTGADWRLLESQASKTPGAGADSTSDFRPLRIFGDDETMDTVGNFDLSANPRPVKCPRCIMVDIDAVPEPYLLSRGFTAPGDFRSAELGNFFVRQRVRQILEIAAPNACRFYPTFHGKSKQPTDWFLAVPQTTVQTAKLPQNYVKCSACGEPKAVGHLEPLEFEAPPVDIFKSLQWTCSQIGEETPWYLKGHLKLLRDKVPSDQWTRLGLDRELWMSSRLLLLMKHFKLVGSYASELRNRKPTPEEAEWIAVQVNRIKPNELAVRSEERGSAEWLREYLAKNRSILPMTSRKKVQDWERKHNISLPPSYVEFVTTIRRNSYSDVMGREGYNVRILGPKGLDAYEYRRDAPESESELSEPDGLLFAVAINGDGFCFDLRGKTPEYPVVHFNHETDAFEPFADNFAEAVRRFVEHL